MNFWKRRAAAKESPSPAAHPGSDPAEKTAYAHRTTSAIRPSVLASGQPADPPLPDGEAALRDGAAWVESGSLKVRNPIGRGRWPSVVVEPDGSVQLYVNGERATGAVVLRAEDDIEIRKCSEEHPGSIQVSVSEDELSAWVTVRPSERTIVSVPDVPPNVQIQVTTSTRTESAPHGQSSADVLTAMADAGVRTGIEGTAVEHALRAPGERLLVARGQAAPPGRAAALWSVIHGSVQGPTLSRPESGTLMGPRPYVETGQPIAQLTLGTAGQAGVTVTGRTLPPPTVWLPQLIAGNGVLLSADGLTAIAATAGHPDIVIDSTQVVTTVQHELQISGDVDDQHPDVVQAGDVWIGGSVHPNSRVRATGNIEIRGRVVRARVEAESSLRILGGAAYAHVVAGGRGLLYAQLVPLYEQIERFIEEAHALEGGVRLALLQITPVVRRLERVLSQEAEAHQDASVSGVLPQLHATMRMADGPATPSSEAAVLKSLAEAITGGLSTMRSALSRPAHCFVHHLDNGRIEATGDVELGEAGALRSHVVTLGSLVAHGPFRGGSVIAMGGATFVSVGSPGESTTRVQVGEHAVFRAAEVLAGTVVVNGSTSRQFDAPARNIVLGPVT